jgi:hypothetical protein
VIEQIVEHRVFRAQDVGDFHAAIFRRAAGERSKILQILFGHPWPVIHRNGDDRNLAAGARAAKF